MNRSIKPGISIVIMAHDRQDETLRAVQALFKVDFGCPTEIVVSDNPSVPDKIIRNLPDSVIHKVRNPSGDGVWHANQILSEVDHEWTLLTHDDDEMLPSLGALFRKWSSVSDVDMITGKSRIVVNNLESLDDGYLDRLSKADLLKAPTKPRRDLFDALFDLGPLFPASAMIVRTSHLLQKSAINPDFNLAGDLAHSMLIAKDAGVIFDGSNFVMTYHIHGNNSVFSVDAAGGLMSDFTIVRLSESVNHKIEINSSRIKMLVRAVFVSRILAKAFHLDSRYSNVKKYATAFNRQFAPTKISWIWLIPIPLGPMKIIVRRLMWKRLGVNKWGY